MSRARAKEGEPRAGDKNKSDSRRETDGKMAEPDEREPDADHPQPVPDSEHEKDARERKEKEEGQAKPPREECVDQEAGDRELYDPDEGRALHLKPALNHQEKEAELGGHKECFRDLLHVDPPMNPLRSDREGPRTASLRRLSDPGRAESTGRGGFTRLQLPAGRGKLLTIRMLERSGKTMFGWHGGIRLGDIVDIGVVAFLIWIGITWLRRTRARLALIGLSILGGVDLLARFLGLHVTATILEAFFAAFVIVVIVVFQDEIRRFFEQIAVLSMRRKRPPPPPDSIEVVARSIVHLAERKTGALFVFPGKEPVDRHLEGGVPLDALASEPLLLSLFDKHSPGHDGAILVEGDRVRLFGARLPLSGNQEQLGTRGTRHAAALCLSERTDSLTVVVSEERGTVSLARDGTLRTLAERKDVHRELRNFLQETTRPAGAAAPAWKRMGTRWLETAFALGIAVLLWLVFSAGSVEITITRSLPIVLTDVPAGMIIDNVEPREVEVTFVGERRHLLRAEIERAAVRLSVLSLQPGIHTFLVGGDDIPRPATIEVTEVRPNRIRVGARPNS